MGKRIAIISAAVLLVAFGLLVAWAYHDTGVRNYRCSGQISQCR